MSSVLIIIFLQEFYFYEYKLFPINRALNYFMHKTERNVKVETKLFMQFSFSFDFHAWFIQLFYNILYSIFLSLWLWRSFQTSHIKYLSTQNLQVELNISSNIFSLSIIIISRYSFYELKLILLLYATFLIYFEKKPLDYNKSLWLIIK